MRPPQGIPVYEMTQATELLMERENRLFAHFLIM